MRENLLFVNKWDKYQGSVLQIWFIYCAVNILRQDLWICFQQNIILDSHQVMNLSLSCLYPFLSSCKIMVAPQSNSFSSPTVLLKPNWSLSTNSNSGLKVVFWTYFRGSSWCSSLMQVLSFFKSICLKHGRWLCQSDSSQQSDIESLNHFSRCLNDDWPLASAT